MEIEAILEGETLLGKLSRLRKRPARLRTAGERVERGAAKPGIVKPLGDHQAASPCSRRLRQCPPGCLRPSPERIEAVRDQEARDGPLVTGPERSAWPSVRRPSISAAVGLFPTVP